MNPENEELTRAFTKHGLAFKHLQLRVSLFMKNLSIAGISKEHVLYEGFKFSLVLTQQDYELACQLLCHAAVSADLAQITFPH